jgi:Bacteriophage related domain of unknown function
MAAKAVEDAVNARLKTNWTTTAVVDDDTTGSAPDDGAPYVTVQYPVAQENQITVGSPGNNVFRESGAFRIVLNWSSGSGKDEPIKQMDQLRAIFRGKQFSGVTTFAPSPGIETVANYQAGRYVLSCAVPYQFDFRA